MIAIACRCVFSIKILLIYVELILCIRGIEGLKCSYPAVIDVFTEFQTGLLIILLYQKIYYFKNCPKKKAAIGARISELHILIVA